MTKPTDSRPDVVTLKPRRGRWLKRLAVAFVLLVGAIVGGHWIWGERSAARLDARLRELKAAGEPVEPADLVAPAVPDDQNAVVDLRAAAAAVDDESPAWKQWEQLEGIAFPLTAEEAALFKRMLDESGRARPL